MSDSIISQDVRSQVGTNGSAPDQALEHIRQALSGLKFGHVAIIVQDGVVVQVERTERRRLRRSEH